jgi:hypothetical protein
VQQADKGEKNLGDSPSVKEKVSPNEVPRFHTVEIEVQKCVTPNAAQVIIDFVGAVKKVDPQAGLLPISSQKPSRKENAPKEKCGLLTSKDDFPLDDTTNQSITKAFVDKFAKGVRLSKGPTGSMKMKVCIQSECKLSTLQKNKALHSLNGKNRLVIKRHALKCVELHQVGVILNAVTRNDLVTLMETRFAEFFPKGLPAFQVETFRVYRGKESIPLYRVMSAKVDVSSLNKALLKLLPGPSAGMTFIPNETWWQLKPERRTAFLKLHQQFNERHSVLLLRGIKDSEVRISSDTSSNNDDSILQFVKTRKCANGKDDLFISVAPSVNGIVELCCSKDNELEAKNWLSGAIRCIGSRATPTDFEKIFCDPVKARARMIPKSQPGSVPTDAKPSSVPSVRSKRVKDPLLLEAFLQFDVSAAMLPSRKPKKPVTKASKPTRIVYTLPGVDKVVSTPPLPSGTEKVYASSATAIKKRRSRKRKKTKTSTVSSSITVLPNQETNSQSLAPVSLDDSSLIATTTNDGSDAGHPTSAADNRSSGIERSWADIASLPISSSAGRSGGPCVSQTARQEGIGGTDSISDPSPPAGPTHPSLQSGPTPPLPSEVEKLTEKLQIMEKEFAELKHAYTELLSSRSAGFSSPSRNSSRSVSMVAHLPPSYATTWPPSKRYRESSPSPPPSPLVSFTNASTNSFSALSETADEDDVYDYVKDDVKDGVKDDVKDDDVMIEEKADEIQELAASITQALALSSSSKSPPPAEVDVGRDS